MDNTKISERDDRINKLNDLKRAGINPYPAKTNRSNYIIDVISDFESLAKRQSAITLCGRLRSMRSHGNLSFANLEDSSGSIQIAISKKEVGAESYGRLSKLIDMGDFLEIAGVCFLTHKGEKSVMVKSWHILSKALRPLPDKWAGLVDDDKRQRFRELEMLSNNETKAKFKRRSLVGKIIREFMWQNDFIEVETPILQNVYGGTYAKPFMTHYNVLDFDLYLRIAPEIFLKRIVAGGFEKIFEIGKCFRNEGMGPAHLQEFTMFEFYWPYYDYIKLMDFTELLISQVIENVYKGNFLIKFNGKDIDLRPPYPRIAFSDLIKEHLRIEISDLDTAKKIEEYVKNNNLAQEVHLEEKIGWSAKLDELYKKTIRKKISSPIFVTDYPREFMALAKVDEADPKIVNTFQLVVNGWELIKAYNELNDPIDQRERFETQDRLLLAGDEEAMPYDHDFIESMEYGMPPMAGWGMGLDRFISLLEGEDNLRDVIIFPTMKPKDKPEKQSTNK
jgi:lysyl-tRNA synthetase, class II